MPDNLFDSMNPYQNMEVIQGKTPQDLLDKLKEIRTPINIVQIISFGNRIYAYIKGDVRKVKLKKKGPTNG